MEKKACGGECISTCLVVVLRHAEDFVLMDNSNTSPSHGPYIYNFRYLHLQVTYDAKILKTMACLLSGIYYLQTFPCFGMAPADTLFNMI